MPVNPYLQFSGTCEEAFTFYEKSLGAKVLMMMRHTGSPAEAMAPPEWGEKILHASLKIDDNIIFGMDAPANRYTKPAGFFISIGVKTTEEAARIFKELSAGGQVIMDLQETFWALSFAMLTDRFGIPWMINCEKPMQ